MQISFVMEKTFYTKKPKIRFIVSGKQNKTFKPLF